LLAVNWFTVGIASTALLGLIGLVDKIAIDRYFITIWSYPFFTMLFFGLYCTGILAVRIFLGLFHSPSLLITMIALTPSVFHFIAGLFITKALMHADASTVFGISQINPIFALFWGSLIFSDVFLLPNYIGILLIVVCAFLIGVEQSPLSFKLNKVVWIVLGATIIRSLSDLFLKYSLTEMEYWDAFSLSRSGLIIGAMVLFSVPAIRRQIVSPIEQHGWKIIGISGVVETLAVFNLMLLTLAFSLGPLALVSATQSAVPIFILIYSVIINRVSPGFAPVRDNTWTMPVKMILSFGLVVGVFLLYFGHSTI
jgi:uncharacterized membrane protein